MARTSFDYIIVGAGSAGSVLANRLSKNPANRVLLIEAGPPDRSIFLHMPGAFAEPLKNDRFNWFYESAPEPFMDNRQMYCPRGRVLGGSSSINGMCYVRGHAFDYDRWASNALPDWSYAHCLPYFRKAETWEKGSDEYRGDSGPLHVSDGPCKNPLYEAFVEGAKEGFDVAKNLLPYLVAMLCAIGALRASGALDLGLEGIRWLVEALGWDTRFVDALPTALVKPFSGSAARAMLIETMQSHGVDSFPALVAATVQGSTETTFYVLAVYFGAVGIQRARHAVGCALVADFAGIVAAIGVCYWFFG